MALKSIEDEWQGFAKMIFHKMKPAENQEKEMKKAFFSGAWAMFTAMEEIGEPHISESFAHDYLSARRQEILKFKNKIMLEYAEGN